MIKEGEERNGDVEGSVTTSGINYKKIRLL